MTGRMASFRHMARAACLMGLGLATAAQAQQAPHPFEGDPRMTIYRDVVYGTEDPGQQVLDAYIVKSDKPTPVLVRIHAGWSFSNHSRRSFEKRERLFTLVKEAGISVVSITHRDYKKHKFPAPMIDSGRAVQFVRSKAREWNIDPDHIAAIGGSGGGHCSTWVALHDDLADPKSSDPVARQSSRLQCVVPMWTPVDFSRFTPDGKGWTGSVAGMVASAHGFASEDYNKTPDSRKVVDMLSLTTYVTADDPPVFLCYDGTAEMIREEHPPAPAAINDPHHGWHGVLLADRLKAAGVEHVMFMGPNAQDKDRDEEIVRFLVQHLKSPRAAEKAAPPAAPSGDGAGAAAGESEVGFYALYVDFDWDKGYLELADDIKATGLRWLRARDLTPGSERIERALLRAAGDDMHVVAEIWTSLGRKAFQGGNVDEVLKTWRQSVRARVQRFGSGGTLWKEHPEVKARPVRHWEIWGEPNIEMLMPPEGMSRVELYARILTAASEEIRKADPGATIIAFNTSDGAPHHGRGLRPDSLYQGYVGWRRFIREVNELTGTELYDVVGTHPYHQPMSPEEGGVTTGIQMLRELGRKQGFLDKPLWFTEIGYPTVYPNNKQVRDERQQACFLVRMFAVSAAHGVAQAQVMYVRDIVHAETVPGQGETQRNFGFFFGPGKWKEQAVATRVMIALVPDPRQEIETMHEEPRGVWGYWFRGAGGLPVLMAWNSGEGEVERTFYAKGTEATLVDMLGKTVEPLKVSPEGKVDVRLGEAPVYVVPAGADEVKRLLAAPK